MKVTHIEWDTDGNLEVLEELPTEVQIPEGMTDEDAISDWLTEQQEFCHKGFFLEA